MTHAAHRRRYPAYVRRAPRWHDGAGRLLDFGSTFDLRLRNETDEEILIEDLRTIGADLRQALESLDSAQA
jgi:hypothetical protein